MTVLRIGHRGAMGYEPENTLRSLRKALELHCDMIEMDVRVCKTGEVILFHDETLERTTGGSGRVEDKTLKRLRTLDAGKGERIPLLREALDLIGKKAVANIELKGRGTARPAAEVIASCRKEKGFSTRNFLISSFLPEELETFRRCDPEIPVGIVFKKKPSRLAELIRRTGVSSLHSLYSAASPKLIASAHHSGMEVFVWTVDEPGDIARMKKLGVDGIVSNFPDRI